MLIKKINFTVNGIAQSSWEESITYAELIDLAGITMSQAWYDEYGSITIALKEGLKFELIKS